MVIQLCNMLGECSPGVGLRTFRKGSTRLSPSNRPLLEVRAADRSASWPAGLGEERASQPVPGGAGVGFGRWFLCEDVAVCLVLLSFLGTSLLTMNRNSRLTLEA